MLNFLSILYSNYFFMLEDRNDLKHTFELK